MIGLLLAALLGPPSPEELGVQLLKPEPQDVQLAPGADPGSFHFVRTDDLKITFSMEPDFPVRLVAEDYAHHEVTSKLITTPAPFGFEIDLPPGTYTVRTRVHEKANATYSDSEGFQVHIDKSGKLHYLVPPEYTHEFRHRRKMEITSPNNFTTIHGKVYQLTADPLDKRILLDDVLLRWKSLPGVTSYVVTLRYMENPYHGDSCEGEYERWPAHGSSFRFPKDAELNLGSSAKIWVEAGDINGEFGDIGGGSLVIMTPNTEETAERYRDNLFAGDQWIDARSGICFEEVPGEADVPFSHIQIVGVGDGPALNVGLVPDQQLSTVNGKPVSHLDDIRDALAKTPSGGQIVLGVSGTTPRRFTLQLR